MQHRHHTVDTAQDELEIRRLIGVYCDGIVRGDAHTWASVWADDDTLWDVAGHMYRGTEAIVAHWREAMASFRYAFQVAPTGMVDVDGDHATGRWFVQERNVKRDGTVTELWGYYDDRYVKTRHGWRIQSRVLHVVDHGIRH